MSKEEGVARAAQKIVENAETEISYMVDRTSCIVWG